MQVNADEHERHMRRALRLAARGRGRVEPNPMVGCVLVRDGEVVGEGYHRRFGGPHAEVEALRRAGARARGATAYVTLEPCCYHGKTPPCTEALIAAGVARVVIGARDVNPRIGQRSLRQLRRAKIETSVGVCAAEARQLVAPFSKLMHVRRPWVILKWAQSVDGKIATTTGDSKWITDEAMRAHVHRIRGLVDAIAVGVRTVERDDPLLTCREGRPRRIAQRIVLDSALRISPRARLVQTAREVPTWIFCRRGAETARRQRLEKAGCRVTEVAAERRPQVGLSPAGVLDVLGAEEMTNVVVEGGGLLLGAFFDQRLADEVHIYMAPRLLGGAAATGALHGRGSATVSESVVLPEAARMKRLGRGWLLQAVLASGGTDAR